MTKAYAPLKDWHPRFKVPTKKQLEEQARQAHVIREEAIIKAAHRVVLAAEAWRDWDVTCEREIAELTAAVDALRTAREAVS